MLIPNSSDAAAPKAFDASGFEPPTAEQSADPNRVRHILFGNLLVVQTTIKLLYSLGYAEPNDWSLPISTGKVNEVMVILTKPVKVEADL